MNYSMNGSVEDLVAEYEFHKKNRLSKERK